MENIGEVMSGKPGERMTCNLYNLFRLKTEVYASKLERWTREYRLSPLL